MRSLIIFLMSYILISSCAHKNQDKIMPTEVDTTSETGSDPDISSIPTNGVYFQANGNEPFWSLSISEKRIKLKTPQDSILTPHIDPVENLEGKIEYHAQTERAELRIVLEKMECVNSMSGITSSYIVLVESRLTSQDSLTPMKGCGNYYTDYRLHDIWALESIDGDTLDRKDQPNDLPSLELNANENTFSGHTGCNRMNGILQYRYGEIKFSSIATTRRACPDASQVENKMLSMLKMWNHYSIKNNRLTLSSEGQETLLFKKID